FGLFRSRRAFDEQAEHLAAEFFLQAGLFREVKAQEEEISRLEPFGFLDQLDGFGLMPVQESAELMKRRVAGAGIGGQILGRNLETAGGLLEADGFAAARIARQQPQINQSGGIILLFAVRQRPLFDLVAQAARIRLAQEKKQRIGPTVLSLQIRARLFEKTRSESRRVISNI